ncbi:hypothetical protein F442_13228 [Phytophthora nicotianae P10297]|uniref:Uncharacterized protein n=4 Tax=Phytophthora nicotianae TaxID=4792 RepID=W2R6M3_PHYN3|nr:hypothetical protein PPTG_21276 [Phytophthora nicotianae INRA-310]ETK81459.1 hypothetical protein L915_13044 [Phytophthora nicotianae]ETN20344.1 hypothetical protein PPTG_21276 [Phytophthora nicotianae INRA-310]ETO70044.1 hypothetical protein F444_13432 [Phytophthora nicotianae P1976]ETP39304.1 hypothetical protein F442_13228 [Phytophthora nicotianae P10297]
MSSEESCDVMSTINILRVVAQYRSVCANTERPCFVGNPLGFATATLLAPAHYRLLIMCDLTILCVFQ